MMKGTVLGGRYELMSQLSDAPRLAHWAARDDKLGRQVALTIFPTGSTVADAALDSARRAASIDEQRIVRILDVGADGANSYIVHEAHPGAHDLAELAAAEQMHPEEARRIIGEAASALEVARQRGLHHIVLDPRHVLRLADGSVVITQMAVGAALTGHDDLSSAEASAADATALVRLLYTALTGLWPGSDIGLEGIETIAPRADGQLPTPHELVEGVPGDLDAMCGDTLNHGEGPRTPGEVARRLAPWSSQMITAPGRPRRDTPLAADAERPPGRDDDGYTMRRGTAAGATAVAAGAAAASAGVSRKDDTEWGVEPDFGRAARYDTDDTAMFTADEAQAAPERPSGGYDPSFEELDPPVPGFSAGTDDPDNSSSRLALGIVGVCVLLALVLAFLGLRGIGHNAPVAAKPSSSSSSTSAPAPTSSSSSTSSSTSSTPSTTPVQLLGVTAVNKFGYRIGETVSLPQAIDGNPATEWTSLHYLRKPWGGYANFGGVAVKLGTPTVKQIKVTPGSEAPLTADVYVGDVPGTSGTKVGSFSGATGPQTINTTASGQYVTVFITTMAQPAGKSYYQAAISEISVSQ